MLGVRCKAEDLAMLKNNYCSEIERNENRGHSGRYVVRSRTDHEAGVLISEHDFGQALRYKRTREAAE
jgi:hypothetical protein